MFQINFPKEMFRFMPENPICSFYDFSIHKIIINLFGIEIGKSMCVYVCEQKVDFLFTFSQKLPQQF